VLSGVKPQRSTESEQELQEQLVRADLLRAEALMEMGKPDQAIQELQEAYKVKKRPCC